MSGPRVKFDPATGEPMFDPQTGDPIFEDAPAPEAPRIPEDASGAETVARAILPRSFKAAEDQAGILRQGAAGAMDALSLAGRTAASLNAPDATTKLQPIGLGGMAIPVQPDAVKGRKGSDGRGMFEAMADTEGKTLAGRIVRDPALLPTLATGGLAAGAARSLGLTGLRGAAAAGGLLGAESAAIHQADNAAQGREASLGGAAIETAAGAALPVLGSVASKGVAAAGRGLKTVGGRVVESVIKPLDAAKAQGFDIENFFKHKLSGSSLRPAKWMEQAHAKVDALRAATGKKLGETLRASGEEFDGQALLAKVKAEIEAEVKAGNLDPKGAENAIKIFRGRVAAVADPKTGMVPAEAYNNLKRRGQADAEALYKAKNLGTDIHATEKQAYAQKFAGQARQDLEEAVPGVIEPNKTLAETKPFKRSTQKAEDRLAKRDLFSLKGSILGAATGYAIGGNEGAAAGLGVGGAVPLAMYAGNKLLSNPAVGSGLYRLGSSLERLGAAGDRLILAPFAKPDPELLANLEALRAPADLNPPAPPAGRKVFPQPNARRPLAKPAIEPARIDTKGALEQAITTEEGRAAAAAKLAERQAKMKREMIVLSGQAPPVPPQGSADRFAAVADMVPPPQAAQTDENLLRAIQEHNQGLQIDAARAKAAEELAVPAEEKLKGILSRPALSPLPPRKPAGPVIAPNAPPFMEPPKFQEIFDNAGRRPLELKPSELREKLGITGPRKRVITPVSLEMAQARRNKATKYLTETLGREPLPGEVYDLIEKIGDGPLPVVPPKPKLEREFKGRRGQRHLEFINAAVRGDVADLPTKPILASEAPQTFSLQGANFHRIRGKWDNLITYADDQGRKYEFNPKDWIHMDLQEGEVPF